MAIDKADNRTEYLFTDEERQLMGEALKTHTEKVGRKAAADAPQTIKELWHVELIKIEQLARKVLTK